MKASFTSLRGKVSRRIFVTVALCAILPIAGLVTLTLYSANQELTSTTERRLRHACKNIGMALMSELNSLNIFLKDRAATIDLDQMGQQVSEAGSMTSSEDMFIKIWFFREDQPPSELPKITPAMGRHFDQDQPYLSVLSNASSHTILLWSRTQDRNHTNGLIVGQINPDFLWTYAQGFLPLDTELAIVNEKFEPLLIQGTWATELKDHLDCQEGHRYFELDKNGEQWLVGRWKLFLQARFKSTGWHILIKESKQHVYASLYEFRRNSWLIAITTLWIILLASSVLIRKMLKPLDKLKQATQHVGLGIYDIDLSINSNDEFKLLADSFNGMVAKIQQQINRQKGMRSAVREVLSAEEEEQIIQKFFSGLAEITDMDGACLTLFKSDQDTNSKTASSWINQLRTSRQLEIHRATEFSHVELERLIHDNELFTYATVEEYPVFLQPLTPYATQHHFLFYINVNTTIDAVFILADRLHVPDDELLSNIRQLSDQLGVALSRSAAKNELDALNIGVLTALARTVDANSKWTHGHSERVTKYALTIARALNLSESECDDLHHAGLLHDLGKVSIPAEVLNKPGKLTAQEYDLMKSHPVEADQIIEPIKAFDKLRMIVRQHHERWDGNGYPDGIAGEQIHLGARILAVADVYDALYSDRPYRKGWPQTKVIDFLKEESGRMFDPEIVNVLLQNLHRLDT